MKHSIFILFVVSLLSVGACGDPGSSEPPDPTGDPTWHQDVAPIVAEHCQTCHTPGNVAPFSLVEYNEVAPMADFLLWAVESNIMPPWGAGSDDDCEPLHALKDDPTLSAEELATFQAWVAAGAPEGDPSDPAPVPAPPDRSLDGVTHTLVPQAGYATSGSTDEFRCFVLEPNTTETMFLTGVELEPGVIDVVHHATLTLDESGASRALAGPDGSYECFGSVGVPGPIVGGYTPGAPPVEMPADTGLPIAAGAAIVMQIHYHPLGELAPVDVTKVNLRMTSSEPSSLVTFAFFGNSGAPPILQPGPNDEGGVEFRIPANVADHTETQRFVIPGDSGDPPVRLWSYFAHMHYVGVEMDIRVERANPGPGQPDEECIGNVPHYSFDWQRLYSFDEPLDALPTVRGGDILTIECTYDNTIANRKVAEGIAEQGLDEPIDVFLGEESLDEMCIALFGAINPWRSTTAAWTWYVAV